MLYYCCGMLSTERRHPAPFLYYLSALGGKGASKASIAVLLHTDITVLFVLLPILQYYFRPELLAFIL